MSEEDSSAVAPKPKGCLSCCRATSRCALVGWSISSLLWFGVSVTLITILFFTRNSKPPTPCHGAWGPVTYMHRGNLTLAQENTADAVTAGVASGGFSEVDVLATSDGVPHLFHDANALRMTGVDRAFSDIMSEELASDGDGDGGDDGIRIGIEILSVIDGHDYNRTNVVPRAEDVIQSTCRVDPGAAIDLDVKDSPSAEAVVDILASSRCDVGTADSTIIFAIGDPRVGKTLQQYRSQAPDVRVRTSLFLHPNSYGPLGLYFFLKTRLLHWYAGADMISAHHTVWDRDYDVIRGYEMDGFCSAVYGIPNTPEAMARYPTASYHVVDEGPYFPANPEGSFGGDGSGDVTYDGERGGYVAFVTIGFLGIPMFLISAYMTYRNRSHCCCGPCSGGNTGKSGRASKDPHVVAEEGVEGIDAGGCATLY